MLTLGNHTRVWHALRSHARVQMEAVRSVVALSGITQAADSVLVFWLAFSIAHGQVGGPATFVTGMLMLQNMFAHVYNDITDVAIDRANGRNKPLADGRIPIPIARALAWYAAFAALVVGILAGLAAAVVAVLLLVLGFCYSSPVTGFARRPVSAFLTIFTAAALLPFGLGAYLGVPHAISAWTISIIVLGLALLTGGRALLKDVPDMAGDRAGGRSSVALRHGARTAVRRSLGLLIGGAAFAACGTALALTGVRAVAACAVGGVYVVLVLTTLVPLISAPAGHPSAVRARITFAASHALLIALLATVRL